MHHGLVFFIDCLDLDMTHEFEIAFVFFGLYLQARVCTLFMHCLFIFATCKSDISHNHGSFKFRSKLDPSETMVRVLFQFLS